VISTHNGWRREKALRMRSKLLLKHRGCFQRLLAKWCDVLLSWLTRKAVTANTGKEKRELFSSFPFAMMWGSK
jgi:hypothetical protein